MSLQRPRESGADFAAARLAEIGGAAVENLTRPLAAGERPEDRLLELGLVSPRDLALRLAERSGLDMVGLRGFSPDPRLFRYVPLDVCDRERVVPIHAGADRLTVATAFLEPDLAVVERRFPKLSIELQVAPHGEVREVLRLAAEALRQGQTS